MTCGPECAGAVAGAVGNATTQGINWMNGQAVSAWNFVAYTALSALGGKVAGTVVPYVFKSYVSNPAKGAIGEAMIWLDLVGSRREIPQTQVRNGVDKSTFDFGYSAAGTFIESKFGTTGLSSVQRTAAGNLGDAFELQSWNYSAVSGIASSSLVAGAGGAKHGGAAGGFLLYPNRPNTNQMQSVYAK